MATHAALLLSLLVLAAWPSQAKLQMFDPRAEGAGPGAGRHLLATNQCVEKGLEGTCNGCVCCCYDGGAGIVNYEPTDACTCKRSVNSSQIWATVVLSIILVLSALLVQLYFGGSLPISPYPTRQQRQARRQQLQLQQQRSGRAGSGEQQQQFQVHPPPPMPPPQQQFPYQQPQQAPPAVLATI